MKIAGVTKGKGFAGTIKRHNFASGPKAHGSHNVRAPGIGRRLGHAVTRVQGHPLPGETGKKRATQKGLEIISIDAPDNLLLVRGSVPGPRNSVVEVRTDA